MKKLIYCIILIILVTFAGCAKDSMQYSTGRDDIGRETKNISEKIPKNIRIEVSLEPCLDYDNIRSYSEGMAIVYKQTSSLGLGLYGYINEKGEEVIPVEYTSVKDFCEGYAVVSKERGEYGDTIIDKNGNEIMSVGAGYIGSFNDGLAVVKHKGFFHGYVDTQGNKVITLASSDNFSMEIKILGASFSEGLACAYNYETDKYGYLDRTGNIAIPFEYDRVNSFSEGVAVVKKDGESYIIDKDNKVIAVIDDLYWMRDRGGHYYFSEAIFNDKEHLFSNGLLVVESARRYGEGSYYINKKGKRVIENVGYHLYPFHDGVALVGKFVKIGEDSIPAYAVIDEKGRLLTDYKYECGIDRHFNEGVVYAWLASDIFGDNMTNVYIDKNGKEIIKGIWGGNDFNGGYAPFKYEIEGPWGILKLVTD